jgi:hypothetical protein
VINQKDPLLLGHVAIWEATHRGEENLTTRERLYQRHLHDRYAAVRGNRITDHQRRWLPLVTAIDPLAPSSAEYPALAEALTRAFDLDLDIDRLLPDLLHGRDYPAALQHLYQVVAKQHDQLDHEVEGALRTPSLHLPTVSPDFAISTYQPPSF